MTPLTFLLYGWIIGLGLPLAPAKELPCHTRSRQMTLIKNCYTGDMSPAMVGGPRFFGASDMDSRGASYCFNSLVSVEQQERQSRIAIRVLRDGKDNQFHSYNYWMMSDDLRKMDRDIPYLEASGLKVDCFASPDNRDACDGGWLKMIGLGDTRIPLVMAIGKATNGHYTLSHLVSSRDEIQAKKPRALAEPMEQDNWSATWSLLQDIRARLIAAANAKMSSLRNGSATTRKILETSSQFRFCSMALEGFLKDKKIQDPFSPEEKMTLFTLTNYMNGSGNNPQSFAREPATTRAVASPPSARSAPSDSPTTPTSTSTLNSAPTPAATGGLRRNH